MVIGLSTPQRDQQQPGRPRRRGLWAAGGFAAAVIIAMIVVLVATSGGGGGGGAPASQPGHRQAGGGAQHSGGGKGGPAALPTTPPTSAPPGVHWQLYHGVALPYSKTAGPAHVHGAVAAGYAHSPTGALIAAVQIDTRALVSPHGSWRAVVRQQVVANKGRRVYAKQRGQVGDSPPAGGVGQIAGFRFLPYSPQLASVQIATRFASSGDLQMTTLTVKWVDGDWKQVLQPDGSDSPSVQNLKDITGFVRWSGV
jgi:hypothetical protein